MKTDRLLAALVAERCEVARFLKRMDQAGDKYRTYLASLDGVIRGLSVDIDPEILRMKRGPYRRNPYFLPKDLPRLRMDVFRLSEGALLTTDRVVIQVITAKGFDAEDRVLHAKITAQVRTVLRGLIKREVVERVGTGRATQWKLADI
jgi:hypothetical protein